ncbi:MAG: lysylphosphatidylglycerol synthase transmembrane domain-containing protein [Gammaproteobacteria bacterium]
MTDSATGSARGESARPDDPKVGERKKGVRRTVLRYLLAAIILGCLFLVVPFSDVVAVMRTARPEYLLVALGFSLLSQWLIAVRLRLVVQALGVDFSTTDLFSINAATRFYGLFLPGGNVTGIAVRFYKMSGGNGEHAVTAVTLFSERVVATLTLCLVGLMFWWLEEPQGMAWLALVMLAGVLATTLLLLLLMGHVSLPVSLSVDREGRLGRALSRIRDAIQLTRALPKQTLLVVFALSVLIHLVSVLAFLTIALSMGMNMSFVTMGWIRSGLILAAMIPVSVSGVGLRELAAIILFEGFSNEAAVAFAIMVFVVTVLVFGLFGGAVEARRYLSR